MLLVLVGVHQPPGPAGDVDHERDQRPAGRRRAARRRQRNAPAASGRRRTVGRRRSTARPACRTPPSGRSRSTWCRPRARSRPRRASSQGRKQQPAHRPPVAFPAYLLVASVSLEQPRQLRAEPEAVVDQAGDAAEEEERQEDVEQREPRQHEVEPVEGQQQPGNAAEHRRAGQPPDQAAHHQHHQRADDRRGDPPAEGIHAEGLLAERDQPLADVGVDDHRRLVLPEPRGGAVEDRVVDLDPADLVDVVAHVAVVQHRPGVFGVVGLVELEDLRRAEVPQPQAQRQQRDADRREPAEQPPARGRSAAGRAPRPGVRRRRRPCVTDRREGIAPRSSRR